MNKSKPSWDRWLRAAAKDDPERLGFEAQALGRCTGQDYRALAAVAACWELYTVADTGGELAALQCVRELLSAMQPSCWIFARALIARSMDWRDRERLWPLVCGGKCNVCGDETELLRFGGFLLCKECFAWAGAQAATAAAAAKRRADVAAILRDAAVSAASEQLRAEAEEHGAVVARALVAQRFPLSDPARLHNAGVLADRCEWEGCGRTPDKMRGHFRFCEKHAAEIDARDPCVDCEAGNCGVHREAE